MVKKGEKRVSKRRGVKIPKIGINYLKLSLEKDLSASMEGEPVDSRKGEF